MACPYCQGDATQELDRVTALGYQLYRCRPCRRTFVAVRPLPLASCLLPREILLNGAPRALPARPRQQWADQRVPSPRLRALRLRHHMEIGDHRRRVRVRVRARVGCQPFPLARADERERAGTPRPLEIVTGDDPLAALCLILHQELPLV